jgi:pycsar effector protein
VRARRVDGRSAATYHPRRIILTAPDPDTLVVSTGADANAAQTSDGNPDQESLRLNIDLAWRSHAAQESWTAKVDTKASIALAANAAVLTAIVASRTQKGSYLEQLTGWREVLLLVAVILCVLAVVCAGAIVFPLLGRRRIRRRPARDTIYFGDLRHRDPGDLRDQLLHLTPHDHLAQLARQLVAMARYNWFKHSMLQIALATAYAGYLLVFVLLVV